MAKQYTVRNPKQRVSGRSRIVSTEIPQSKNYADGTYLFTVVIQGYKVPVFLTKKFEDPDITGAYVQLLDEIYMTDDENLSDERKVDTILHETLHAISHIAMAPKDRLNERQVNTIATVLSDTLRRSPEFKKYITRG